MPYGYFQLVRFVGMIGFAILGFEEYKNDKIGWAIFYFASVILINPLFKVSLGRTMWNIVDIIWVIILLITIYIDKKRKLNYNNKPD